MAQAAGVGTAAGLALASPKAFGDAFWLAIAPEAGVGPAGWIAIGVTIVAEIILEIFDPFGGSTPELTRKEWHRQHSEQADEIGTPIPDQKPSVKLPCDGLPLQPDAGNLPIINAPFIGFHYCGHGDHGGEPTNPTDACCEAHDCAYGAAGLSGANVNVSHPGVGAGAAQRQADAALCKCVRGVPGAVGQTYLRQIQMGIGKLFCYGQ